MKKLSKYFICAILILLARPVLSQDYATGVGVRLGGFNSGVTVKDFISENEAFEGIAGFGHQSFVLTALYQYHFPLDVTGLKLYGGGGAHLGFFGYRGTYKVFSDKNENIYVEDPGHTAVIPGVDFIFGIEYKFNGAPLLLGADLKPFFDFYHGTYGYADGALNLRYVF